MTMKAALGGTFNVLHDGHKKLLDRAFEEAGIVLIGITSDEMASSSRERLIPFNIRKKGVESYLSGKTGWTIFEIRDIYGPAVEIDDIDILVVSEETYDNGVLVNQERMKRGMHPLSLSVVQMHKNGDGDVIRARQVVSGEYSRSGERNAMSIAVGSTNPVKTEAVRTVMEKVFGDVKIIAVNVTSDVPEQPWGEETCRGAANRAKTAMNGHDLSVGIEAGVFEMYDGIYDIQHCVILDRNGRMTIGMSSGFRYPDDVAEMLRNGSTVGDAMRTLYTKDARGRKEGAVGVLSKGLLDRKSLTEQSVTAAMIPRMKDIGEKNE